MSELDRLSIDPTRDAFDRTVLRSASTDRVSPRARLAAQVALGISVTAAATATTTTATAATAATKLGGWLTAMKIATAIAVTTAAGYVVVPMVRDEPSLPAAMPVRTGPLARLRPAEPSGREPSAATPTAAPIPTAATVPIESLPASRRLRSEPALAADRLGEEVSAIEAARASLAA